jgi:hypothetical protein
LKGSLRVRLVRKSVIESVPRQTLGPGSFPDEKTENFGNRREIVTTDKKMTGTRQF